MKYERKTYPKQSFDMISFYRDVGNPGILNIHVSFVYSESQVRRRNREERKKKTEEQVRRMKDKLRESELSKKRKSYLKPVAIGLTLLLGGILIYTFCFKT